MLPTKYSILITILITILILPIILLSACSSREQLDTQTDKPAAPNDDFRSDTPAIIATSGRPQLIELYADW
jgi:hypothetical protein